DRSVCLAFADKQVAKIERVFQSLFTLLERDAFGTAHLVIDLGKTLKIVRFAVVENVDTVEVRSRFGSKRSYLFFVPDDGYFGDAVSRTYRRGLDRPRVVAFWKDNMLNVGRRSLADLLEDHTNHEFITQPNRVKQLAQTRPISYTLETGFRCPKRS